MVMFVNRYSIYCGIRREEYLYWDIRKCIIKVSKRKEGDSDGKHEIYYFKSKSEGGKYGINYIALSVI